MKRQRGRNRGGGGGGGKPQQQNANRAFDSNGPEGVKVRGNAQHVFEKYQQLARDASASGDRVLAESYLQHAEHYFRVVRAMQPQKPTAEILGRDQFSSGFDIDFEDESGAQAAAAAAAEAGETGGEAETNDSNDGETRESRGERWRDDRGDRPRGERDDRPRGDRFEGQGQGRRDRWRDRDDRPRNNEDRPRGDRDERPREARDDRPRDDRPRDDRPREDRPRNEDRPRGDRDERPRGEREDRPRRDRDRDRDREDRGDRDPLAVVEPQAAPLVAAREERPSPVLRDDDGGESHAPAFLKPARSAAPKAAPVEADAGEEKPKPRRRRAPRSFEGDGAPSNESEEA